MNEGFVKLMRTHLCLELIKKPKVWAVLSLIALRTRRTPSLSKSDPQMGEAFIGDLEACGLTESEYRTAKRWLRSRGIVTFKNTNKGTIARLVDTSIFDVNLGQIDGQGDGQMTDRQRLTRNQEIAHRKEFPNLGSSSVPSPVSSSSSTSTRNSGKGVSGVWSAPTPSQDPRAVVSSWPKEKRELFEERAAILRYDSKMPWAEADREALRQVSETSV